MIAGFSSEGVQLGLSPSEYSFLYLVLSYVLHGLRLDDADFANILGMGRDDAEALYDQMKAAEVKAKAEGLRWQSEDATGSGGMVRPELILMGYWRGAGTAEWPEPTDFIHREWDPDERELVADYLGRGFVVRAYMGYSPCRICGRENGALELSDGVYVWPEGLAHYLTDHGARPPDRFVAHVLAKTEEFESAGRDESWWRSLAE